MVDGLDPEPELAKIAAGLYDMNPRPEFEGRGYLKATWDHRDPRPSVDLVDVARSRSAGGF